MPMIQLPKINSKKRVKTSPAQRVDLRRSIRLINHGPIGFLGGLPMEMLYNLFDYLSLNEIGRLGQCSKEMSATVVQWIRSELFLRRIIKPILSAPCQEPLSDVIRLQCFRIGMLIKKLTIVVPSGQRMLFLQNFISRMRMYIEKKRLDYNEPMHLAMMGAVLHALIAGWDRTECRFVYATVASWFRTHETLLLFMNKLLGYDKDAELLLRWQLRLLFLDSCSADDQVMWCDIIFHECSAVYAPTVFHQAKLALLLSAPLTFSGREGSVIRIRWDFYEDPTPLVLNCTSAYHQLATLLERLTHLEQKKGAPKKNSSLLILTALFGSPSPWPTRSIALLLLCLHQQDSRLVIQYLEKLAQSKTKRVFSLILSDILYTATFSEEFLEASIIPTAVKLIKDGLNAGWLEEDRNFLIDELCGSFRTFTSELLERGILEGGEPLELSVALHIWTELMNLFL